MKKILVLIAALSLSCAASAQTNDKLDFFNIDIFDMTKKRSSDKSSDRFFRTERICDLMIGFTGGMGQSPYDFAPAFGQDVAVEFQGVSFYPARKYVALNMAVGFSYTGSRLENGNIFQNTGKDLASLPYNGKENVKSTFKYNSIYVPVSLVVHFSHVATFHAGAEFDFNFAGRARNNYEKSDTEKMNGLRLNPFTMSYRAGFNFSDFDFLMLDNIGVFVKYRPQSVLNSKLTSHFGTYSVGLSFDI